MARLLGNWFRLEVRTVIQFLCAKNMSISSMSRQYVVELCQSFRSGRQDCRKQQYDMERPAKFFNDRNHHGTTWRNDSK
ncbi:hypothetical protein TNCV_3355841 [Trichonephila clavipes]|nr:hypothetical protein TNCV_3355841 [Trichonephila clavipes]